MKLKRWQRALLPGLLATLAMGLLHAAGFGLAILLTAAVIVFLATGAVPSLGVRLVEQIGIAWRAFVWREEQGRHHAFAGIALHIEEDGRHVWLLGDDLQNVLRTREPEDALAARHAGRWRRDGEERLWLRVDSVVERLATMPRRDDPRHQKLRRYFEREVLFPAAERRRRAR